jgi:hypothetical protein
MRKLSKILTLVCFLSLSTSAFADQQCEDEEVKMGEFKKSVWEHSISQSIQSELVNQLAKKDDLFEKLSPEIKFDITPFIDFEFQLTRAVKSHLPVPSNNTISTDDLFKYKINNKLRIQFEGEADAGVLFSNGIAGVHLTHSTERLSQAEMSNCELYSKVINKNTKKGNQLVEAVCTKRHESMFKKYYDKTIDFFSSKIGAVFNRFADSEKNVIWAEDPLSALKLHSMLGLPLDPEVFYENNTNIAIGDIVEHTTFYSITPLGVKLDIFKFMTPSYGYQFRFFRTLSFKKVYGNKVLVDITDTMISGGSLESFKINPKLFGLLKLNFGKHGQGKFDQKSLTQSFEVNLLDKKGESFFNKLLLAAYAPKLSLHKKTILVSTNGYESGVKAFEPVFKDGYGKENKLVLQIPGFIKMDYRSHEKIEKVEREEQSYLKGDKLYRRNFKNKFEMDLWLFKIRKADRKYQCQMKLEINNDDENFEALNIECNYADKYASNEKVHKMRESLLISMNGNIPAADREALENLRADDRIKISMHTNLSFSKRELTRIRNTNDTEIYAEISKMIFGETAENIFAPKYHEIWQRIKTDRNSSHSMKGASIFKQCHKLLKAYSITDEKEEIYEKMDGIVGRNKGLKSNSSRLCHNAFRTAKRLYNGIRAVKDGFESVDNVEEFLDIYRGIDYAGLVQNLFVRLAGGFGKDKVRFNYFVNSHALEEPLIQTNGINYTANIPDFNKSISEDMEALDFPRLKKIGYFYNECRKDELKVLVGLDFPLDRESNLSFLLDIKKFSVANDYFVSRSRINIKDGKLIDDKHYEFTIKLPEIHSWKNPHNAYLKLVNNEDYSVSKETKTFVQSDSDKFGQNGNQ